MIAYHWPGNVRELENCIEHAVLLAEEGVIHSHNLPPTLKMPDAEPSDTPGSLKARVTALERDMITDALKRNGGNAAAAARELGNHRTHGPLQNQEPAHRLRHLVSRWRRASPHQG